MEKEHFCQFCDSVHVKQQNDIKAERGRYQGVEGRHGEDAQSAHGQLGGPRGHGQEPLGVGQLSSLQAGQVAPEAE